MKAFHTGVICHACTCYTTYPTQKKWRDRNVGMRHVTSTAHTEEVVCRDEERDDFEIIALSSRSTRDVVMETKLS